MGAGPRHRLLDIASVEFEEQTYQGEVYSILSSPGTWVAITVTSYPASARNQADVRPVTPALVLWSAEDTMARHVRM